MLSFILTFFKKSENDACLTSSNGEKTDRKNESPAFLDKINEILKKFC